MALLTSTSIASRPLPGGRNSPSLPTAISVGLRCPRDVQRHADQPLSLLPAPLQASLSQWLERERHSGSHAVRPSLRASRGCLLSTAGCLRGALPRMGSSVTGIADVAQVVFVRK